MFLRIKTLSRLIIFAVFAGLLLCSADSVSAQIVGLTNRPLSEIIGDIIDWLLEITAGLAILFIIIGGILYVTAEGDEQRMTMAKNIITYAIFGLLIIIISYSIIKTIACAINPSSAGC